MNRGINSAAREEQSSPPNQEPVDYDTLQRSVDELRSLRSEVSGAASRPIAVLGEGRPGEIRTNAINKTRTIEECYESMSILIEESLEAIYNLQKYWPDDTAPEHDEDAAKDTYYDDELDSVVDEVIGQRESVQAGRRRLLFNKLNTIMPTNAAIINLPVEVDDAKVLRVNRWQRSQGLSPQQADEAYINLSAKAKTQITNEFKEATLPAADLERIRDLAQDGKQKYFDHRLKSLTDKIENIGYLSRGGDLLGVRDVIMSAIVTIGNVAVRNRDLSIVVRDISRRIDLVRDLNSLYEIDASEDVQKEASQQVVAELRQEWNLEVDEVFYGIVRAKIAEFNSWLDRHDAPPAPSAVNQEKRKSPAVGRGAVQGTVALSGARGQQEKKPIDPVSLSNSNFLWMVDANEEDRQLQGELHGSVLFVDGRTGYNKQIEAKSFDYRQDGERDKVVVSRIENTINRIRNMKYGHRTMARVRDALEDIYPYGIVYHQIKGRNPDRVYFTVMPPEVFGNEEQKQLEKSGIKKVLVLVGACRKSHQEYLMIKFTGKTHHQVRSAGAGST